MRYLLFTDIQSEAISLMINRIISLNIDENDKIQKLYNLYVDKHTLKTSNLQIIKESDDMKNKNIINQLIYSKLIKYFILNEKE